MRVVQAGGVKLHEFHIDHAATSAPRHRNAIAGVAVGIGGDFVDFARAARGQHGETRLYRADLVCFTVLDIDAVAARVFAFLLNLTFVFVGNEVYGNDVFKHLNIAVFAHTLGECDLNRVPREVIRMHHAAVAVAALARQMQFARIVILHGELDPLRHQPFDRRRRVGNDVADGFKFAQLGTSDKGIADVVFKMVVRVHYGGNPALRQIGRTADQAAFGDQGDFVLFSE